MLVQRPGAACLGMHQQYVHSSTYIWRLKYHGESLSARFFGVLVPLGQKGVRGPVEP